MASKPASGDRGPSTLAENDSKSMSPSQGKSGKKKPLLPKEAVTTLRKWLYENRYFAYPTKSEQIELSKQTDLTLRQVKDWILNARRRILPEMIRSEGRDPRNFKIHRGPPYGRIIPNRINSSKPASSSSSSTTTPQPKLHTNKSNNGLSSDLGSSSSQNHPYQYKLKKPTILEPHAKSSKGDSSLSGGGDSLPTQFVIRSPFSLLVDAAAQMREFELQLQQPSSNRSTSQ